MNNMSSTVLFAVMLIVVVVFSLVVMPRFDRERIRENIEAHGGKTIEILRAWGFGGQYGRAYEVSYMTARGERIKATCTTSMWVGVNWISEHPPGSASDESRTEVLVEERGPAEPIQCLDCGMMIPADGTRCPQCGWSYKGA